MKWSKEDTARAVELGASIVSWVLQVTPTGSAGKVIAHVLGDVIPRVAGWFSKPIEEVKDDALYKVLRPKLRSRVLLEIERAKREQ